MLNKKNILSRRLFLLTAFSALFLFFSLNSISAANTCYIASSAANCLSTQGGQVVMHLSATTNAHGELSSQSSYPSVLCCNFGTGSTTCTGNNKILGLSSPTNAHAEIPDLGAPNYNTYNVCYDAVSGCSSIPSAFNCGTGQTEVAYLSASSSTGFTNAHLESPGLSPQNYPTKICCTVQQAAPPCILNSATWQYSNVSQGTNVGITVNAQNCAGVQVSFAVYRIGALSDTPCTSINGCIDPSPVTFGGDGSSITGSWAAGPAGSSKYYVKASLTSNPSMNVRSSTPDLFVNNPIDCTSVGLCNDYTSQSDCNSNVCNINVQNSVPSSVDCSAQNTNCFCSFNAGTNSCQGAWNASNITTPTCNNGRVEAGETCDPSGGSNFGSVAGCQSFDSFTGGNLSCNSQCQIDTSSCTGGNGPGICGNGIVNTGEQCDGNPGDATWDWGPVVGCGDLNSNFTGGSLSCTSTCLFNTSKCTTINNEVGTCYYTADTSDTCQNDGFLTVNFTANWTWAVGNTGHYDPQNLSGQCRSGPETLQCPAQIPLPFFGAYNIIAALAAIAVIYVIIEMNRKKGKK